jgi:hypothetical protein
MEFNTNFAYIHTHFWECLPSVLWWNTVLEMYVCVVNVITQVYAGFTFQAYSAFILSSYPSANSTTRLRMFQDNYWCANLQGMSFHLILGWVVWGRSPMDKFPTILNENQIKFFIVYFTIIEWYWWSYSTPIPFTLLMRFWDVTLILCCIFLSFPKHTSCCKLGFVPQSVDLSTKVFMLLMNVLLENNSLCNWA